MPITDAHVAAVRALLVRDVDGHQRAVDQLAGQSSRTGYYPLLLSAFMEAVTQRFSGKTRADVVGWVAEARSAMSDPDGLDPDVAERLVMWVFGKDSTDDIPHAVDSESQAILLTLLVDEMDLDEDGLTRFLDKARSEAEIGLSR